MVSKKSNRVTSEEIQDWIQMHEEGMSFSSISIETGRSYKTISKHCKANGITPITSRAGFGNLHQYNSKKSNKSNTNIPQIPKSSRGHRRRRKY